ncbi:MAG TPA: hypothetical protein VI386_27480 [Candidatus Sulfotelmatobacter sp.]
MRSTKNLAVILVLAVQLSAQTAVVGGSGTATLAPKEAAAPKADAGFHFSVTAPRPLALALDSIRVKYGWLVSYEDPKYLFGKDVADAPDVKGSLIPGGAAFSVDVPASGSEPPSEDTLLKAVVDAYNKSGNPGQFEVRKSAEGAVSVVGIAARNEQGAVLPQKPLLDLPITVPAAQRTISDTLEIICKALGKEAHIPVTIGITPRNLVDHADVKAGGSMKPARRILAQALGPSRHPLYWRLIFDPTGKAFVLNIHSLSGAKPVVH